MNLYAASCQPLGFGCFSGGARLLTSVANVPSAYQCQLDCANYPGCILTQYGENNCNLFASDFADTYLTGSQSSSYCAMFGFYDFDSCPVTTPS